MSLHVLAKKTRALRGNSHNKHFAQYMTGSRIRGCCNRAKPPPPGLRRLTRGEKSCKASCPPARTDKPHVDDKLVPKAPIKQMGYGIYLKSRTGAAGPGLLAGRLTSKTVGPSHQSPSLYTELKRLETLKQPACCPAGEDRVANLDANGNITNGKKEFVYGCNYDFTWDSGDITEIHGKNVSGLTEVTINICRTQACMNELVIVTDHDTETRFPILDKPAKACRGPTRQTCCGADVTKQCGCATCHSCPTAIKIDRRGRPWSTKKMRAGYVRMINQKACCTTTKDMSCMSSGDYISRLKARKACPCDNPAQKRVCGNSGTGC